MRNRFPVTLWLTLVALVAALALPARANTGPFPRRAAGWWVRISSMWYRMTAVRWKRLPRSTMSASCPAAGQSRVDPYVPRAGSVLTIPLQTLLPDAPREGLVINLAELRLYYYPPGKNEVTVYPIGIGQLGGTTITPTMVTTVSDKRANPTWTPTANIRARYKAMGIELPAVVPAGPDNPMGHHAIRLAAYGGVYLLHGTNADFGIGMRVSSGCIRLRDNDIKALYNTISPGTKVNIINTPIKASVEPDGRRLVEVHQPLSEHIDDDPQTLPITLNAAMTAFKQAPQTDGTVMERAMNYRSGMPIDVTRHAEPGPQSL